MSFWNYIKTQQNAATPSGAETVERLCQRAQSATLLEDRRDAIRALKSLSRKFRQEVGTQGLEILTSVLHNDRNDVEILSYALDCLCNLLSNEPLDDENEANKAPVNTTTDLGIVFTEMFAKSPANVTQLLSLLEEYDFHVRWPTVKLLTITLINKPKDIQDIILANPLGTPKLMDLLADSREVIRNDALLLLQHLTKANTNIQKIVAFENAFERLLDIVESEGRCDGGVVVEDSLVLLLNLLKNNVSNQNFFKEGSYIQRLAPLFDMPPAEETTAHGAQGWSAQRIANFTLLLQVLRTLVSPNNPQQQTTACQKVMHQCDLLGRLCDLLMASGVPADVLTETINAVSEAIRGCQANQDYFATVMAPTNPPRPAIVILLMSMVNDRQPFALRQAVLYCFECFLYRNDIGQSQIVQTLLPSTAEVTAMSAGQLLCSGLFSSDPLSTWLSAVALLHTVVNNTTQKEQLLRVQLATGIGSAPVSLMQQCSTIMSQSTKIQTRIGLLMLHCHWLAHCPMAVDHFLYITSNIPYLISQVCGAEGDDLEVIVQGLCAFLLGLCLLFNTDQVEAYKRAALRQVIENRIGVELFTDKLLQVTKTEVYSRAAKKPQLNHKQPADVVLDYEFTVLFRKLENDLVRAVSGHESESEVKRSAAGGTATLDQHENIVEHYKELIREQDIQLTAVRNELRDAKSKIADAIKSAAQANEQLQTIKDQNALLKAQKGSTSQLQQLPADLAELTKLRGDVDTLRREVADRDKTIETLRASNGGDNGVASLSQELQHRLELKDEEARKYREQYENAARQLQQQQQQVLVSSADSGTGAQLAELESRLRAAEEERQRAVAETLALKTQLGQRDIDLAQVQENVKQLVYEKTELENKRRDLQSEFDTMKREQDDLLMLLSEQEAKMTSYKRRLKDLGQSVPDDDDEDDDDGLDEEPDFDKD